MERSGSQGEKSMRRGSICLMIFLVSGLWLGSAEAQRGRGGGGISRGGGGISRGGGGDLRPQVQNRSVGNFNAANVNRGSINSANINRNNFNTANVNRNVNVNRDVDVNGN